MSAMLTPRFKRVHLDCTEIARRVRKDLAEAFPGAKFRVRTSRFAGGSAVDVSYTDGPRTRDVDAILGRYQYRHFDGMTDSTSYSEDLVLKDGELIEVTAGAFVHSHRDMSKETKLAIEAELRARYADQMHEDDRDRMLVLDGRSPDHPYGKTEYFSTLVYQWFDRQDYLIGKTACYYCREIPCGCPREAL